MSAKTIALAGGTGTIGRRVARIAATRGHEIRIMSRSAGIDIRSGERLAEALSGADVVIDVVGIPTLSAKKARAFFLDTTARLLSAEKQAGVPHHLLLSIVGVDRAPHGYYGAKLAQEDAVVDGGVPWTILRATQFHDFSRQMFHRIGAGPFRPVSRMRTQPVDVDDVASRLVDLAEQKPAARVRDIAGPGEEDLAEMTRSWAKRHGKRAWMPALAVPGAFGRAMRDGSLLPDADAERVGPSFGSWLMRPDSDA